MFDELRKTWQKNSFLFTELVKRDFKKKYKGTALGMLWSVLSPLLTLLVMAVVFTKFFGRNTPHYIVYLFSGIINFNFYSEATKDGMHSLVKNVSIFSKIPVPKYLFLFSKVFVSTLNYLIILGIYLVFIWCDGLGLSLKIFALIYPVIYLVVLNLGVGLILSALFIFFRDMSYFYDIFTRLLMYVSAVFYNINRFPVRVQKFFCLNPVFLAIKYFRLVVIENTIPSLQYHLLMAFYAILFYVIGHIIYKRNNYRFIYYI